MTAELRHSGEPAPLPPLSTRSPGAQVWEWGPGLPRDTAWNIRNVNNSLLHRPESPPYTLTLRASLQITEETAQTQGRDPGLSSPKKSLCFSIPGPLPTHLSPAHLYHACCPFKALMTIFRGQQTGLITLSPPASILNCGHPT